MILVETGKGNGTSFALNETFLLWLKIIRTLSITCFAFYNILTRGGILPVAKWAWVTSLRTATGYLIRMSSLSRDAWSTSLVKEKRGLRNDK